MHSPAAHDFIVEATEANFQTTVIERSQQVPVLVDFWADWCSPCLVIGPVLEKLVKEYQGRWILAKVEADENMKLAGHYKLRGFPTLLLFRDGEVCGHFSGAKPAHWIKQFLQEHGIAHP